MGARRNTALLTIVSGPVLATCCVTGWTGWQVVARDSLGAVHHQHFDTEAEAAAWVAAVPA